MIDFELGKHIEGWNLDADTLASVYGFDVSGSNKVRRVYTAPKRVAFGGKEFAGEFLFNGNKLIRIYLIPIMEGVEIPNYPSEEYEKTKIGYCRKVLEEIYGDRVFEVENGVRCETANYDIRCTAITEGRDQNTGGNIIIDMR